MFHKKKISVIDNEPEIMTKEMELEYNKTHAREELSYQRKFGKRKTAKLKIADEKKSRKERMKKRHSEIQKEEVVIKEEITKPFREIKKEKASKKDLSSYFEKSKKQNRKLLKKEFKEIAKNDQKTTMIVPEELEDIQTVHVYKYRDKKFFKVEHFISYLEDHYLEMDRIAKEVLDDENFYGWLNNNSGMFPESLRYFKELKEIIEKK